MSRYDPLYQGYESELEPLREGASSRYRTSSPVLVIHVRRDRRLYTKQSAFFHAWQHSSHTTQFRYNVNYFDGEPAGDFLEQLAPLFKANAPCVFVVGEDLHFSTHLLEYSMRFLMGEEAERFDAVAWGSLLVDEFFHDPDGTARQKIWCDQADEALSYEGALDRFNRLDRPEEFLSHFIFKAEPFFDLIKDAERVTAGTASDLVRHFWNQTFGVSPLLNIKRCYMPMLTHQNRCEPEALRRRARSAFEVGELERAEELLRGLVDRSEAAPNDRELLAEVLRARGNIWESKIQMSAAASDLYEKNGQASIDLIAPERLEYETVKPTLETVGGLLGSEEEQYIFDAVAALPPNSLCLEIGVYKGRTTAAIALAGASNGIRVVAVDAWSSNMHQVQDIFRDTMSRLGLTDRVTIFAQGSEAFLRSWQGEQFDFVFIDGDHRYEAVALDFKLVFPHVKPGGTILFHDVSLEHPGVWLLWRRTASRCLTNVRFNGTLAIGQKQEEQQPELLALEEHCFAKEYAHYLRTDRNESELGGALKASLSPDLTHEDHELAEALLTQNRARIQTDLTAMLRFNEVSEPVLHYWSALVHRADGELARSYAALKRADELKDGPFARRMIELEIDLLKKLSL